MLASLSFGLLISKFSFIILQEHLLQSLAVWGFCHYPLHKKVEWLQKTWILSILFQVLYLTKLPPLLELFVIPLVIEQHPVCLRTLQLQSLLKSSWVSWNSFIIEISWTLHCTSNLFNQILVWTKTIPTTLLLLFRKHDHSVCSVQVHKNTPELCKFIKLCDSDWANSRRCVCFHNLNSIMLHILRE